MESPCCIDNNVLQCCRGRRRGIVGIMKSHLSTNPAFAIESSDASVVGQMTKLRKTRRRIAKNICVACAPPHIRQRLSRFFRDVWWTSYFPAGCRAVVVIGDVVVDVVLTVGCHACINFYWRSLPGWSYFVAQVDIHQGIRSSRTR